MCKVHIRSEIESNNKHYEICNLPTPNRYSAASDIRRQIDSINEAVYIEVRQMFPTGRHSVVCFARQESIIRVFAYFAWPHQHVSLHANQCIILNWLQFGLPTCFASMQFDVRNYIFSIDSAGGARFMLMPACNYYSIVFFSLWLCFAKGSSSNEPSEME